MRNPLIHRWWHDSITGQYYAVATEHGRIVSAWMQVAPHRWEALDDFGPLEGAHTRAEMHVNDHPDGYTDELTSSLGPVQ